MAKLRSTLDLRGHTRGCGVGVCVEVSTYDIPNLICLNLQRNARGAKARRRLSGCHCKTQRQAVSANARFLHGVTVKPIVCVLRVRRDARWQERAIPPRHRPLSSVSRSCHINGRPPFDDRPWSMMLSFSALELAESQIAPKEKAPPSGRADR